MTAAAADHYEKWFSQTTIQSREIDPRGYAAVGLVRPKTAENFGAVLRAAKCFGTKLIVAESARLDNHATNTSAAHRHIPVVQCEDILAARPWHSRLVVVEIHPRAQMLHEFEHPQSAFYVFGPEDGSVPERIVEKADHIVRLRSWHCLNLAATVNIVLHDRTSKRGLG